VIGSSHGHADAGSGLKSAAENLERPLHLSQDATGNDIEVTELRNVLDEQREFVSTETGGGVLGAQRVAQPLGDSNQQRIAGCVSACVIQILESIEIEKQDTAILIAATGPAMDGNGQPIEEQHTIRQSREAVMQCIVL